MTPETIIKAFAKQVETCDQTKPFQVFYVTRKLPTPDPAALPQPWHELSVSINLAVYDVPALVKLFEHYENVGFQGKNDALPIFEPITLLIP